MKCLSLALSVLCLSLALQAQAQQSAPDSNRGDFGNTDLPIWSELNDFEYWASREAAFARAGNADALLAHYLLASGDRRSMSDFRRYRAEIDSWISELQLSSDPRRRHDNARIVFQAMHQRFLGTAVSADATPLNYREDQSQLSQIFEAGQYNCISSALLYLVAVRKLGLEGQGVILPSHAFVQLNLGNEVVEVETTSLSGFGLEHDAGFYAAASANWFSDRGLAPPNYDEYLERQIVSPFKLGLFNMINQHTSDERMSYPDRMRLAELRARQMPDDDAAQKSRLSYYYQEFTGFQERDDYHNAMRMFDQVAPYLLEQERRPYADPDLPILLTAIQAQMAESLSQTGRNEESLALARRLLQSRDFSGEAASIEDHLFALVSGYAVNRAEHADYIGARVAFDTLESQCLHNQVCNSGLAHVYSSWAMHYVEDKNWERSADIYQEYLLLDSSSKLSEHFSTNLERVYLNWASGEEWRGEWEIAQGLLNECTQMLSTAARCESALLKINARRDAGYL
ncbi:MAG: transglutaminase family protein [Halieaceae bacterium]